jgi:hypothetical protein
MSKINTVQTHPESHAQLPMQPASVSPQAQTCRAPAGHRTLYVLGFGLLGAILTNALVFIYFASFYPSG